MCIYIYTYYYTTTNIYIAYIPSQMHNHSLETPSKHNYSLFPASLASASFRVEKAAAHTTKQKIGTVDVL